MTSTGTAPSHPLDRRRPATPELPAVLGLRPHREVFRIGSGGRFVGLDPGTAVVADDLPDALAAMLDELTTAGPVEELVERAVARGAPRSAAVALLAELHAAGAVVDATAAHRKARRRAESTVLVEGAGPLTAGVAIGLASAGVGAVHVRTTGTVLATDLGTGLIDTDRGRPRTQAVAAAVAAAAPSVVTGPAPARAAVDLVVLADALVPEPVLVEKLHVTGTTHLPVRLRDGTGVVGPLVMPGRTACLRCLELHRRARDPAWPAVAAQLVGRSGRADPSCAVATAALATAQALVALDGWADDGGSPPTLDATLELDVSAAVLRCRPWPPHPDCGCGAAGRQHSAEA